MTTEQRERLELLITALESGAYPQTQHSLRNKVGFCCLGLACEVYRLVTGHGEWHPAHITGGFRFVVDQSSDDLLLPEPVREWYGFDSSCGVIHAGSPVSTLAGANDAGESFREIAHRLRDGQVKMREESSNADEQD